MINEYPNNRRDAEARSKDMVSPSRLGCRDLSINEITESMIGAGIEIHRRLGPGRLESAYEECLCHELDLSGSRFERQRPLPVHYKGVKLDCGYRLDLVVEDSVIVGLKTVDGLQPIHEAQLITYLRLSGLTVGLLINFNVPVLRNGVKRFVNNFQESSASPRLRG